MIDYEQLTLELKILYTSVLLILTPLPSTISRSQYKHIDSIISNIKTLLDSVESNTLTETMLTDLIYIKNNLIENQAGYIVTKIKLIIDSLKS